MSVLRRGRGELLAAHLLKTYCLPTDLMHAGEKERERERERES